MHLTQLQLREFRNYESLDLSLPEGVVVLAGPNGAGKSNVLEAIYLSSVGESPRAREVTELVRFGQEAAFRAGGVCQREQETRLEVGLSQAGARQIKVNGAPRRRTDLIGLCPVIYFSADDLVVFKGEPGGRRRFLDLELGALSRAYYLHLTRYRRTLEQRNRLLKDLRAGRGRRDALDPWDRAAARYGAEVMGQRVDFLARLSAAAAGAHARLTGGGQPFSVRYLPSFVSADEQSAREGEKGAEGLVEVLAQSLEERLHARREEDIGAGVTTCGPHRDDLELLLEERPLRAFGSQGQQRAASVAIRLGLAGLAEEVTGERPVLMLDDVLSELDEQYRGGVRRLRGGPAGADYVLRSGRCTGRGESGRSSVRGARWPGRVSGERTAERPPCKGCWRRRSAI